jgi:ElaB/YqjD/DUF883 family membrane-anchored ribosome-binding protein
MKESTTNKSAEEGELLAAQEAVLRGLKEAAAATDSSVRSHPWQAIGVGAALGFLLGLLIARR